MGFVSLPTQAEPLVSLQAIAAFLKSMGLTADHVLAEEPLCDALLAYHVLPYELMSSMIAKKDSTAQTLEPNSFLTFNKGASGVTVTDMQGNVARVGKADIKAGEATVHTVDRVLLSGKSLPVIIQRPGSPVTEHQSEHSLTMI